MSNILKFKRKNVKSTEDALSEASLCDYETVHIVGYKDGEMTFIHSTFNSTSEEIGKLQRMCYWLDQASII